MGHVTSHIVQNQQVFSLHHHVWNRAHVIDWMEVVANKNACSHPGRVGHVDDGGWWTCIDRLQDKCGVVYSYGVRDDFSFDKAMAAKGCDVHGFDPSPAGIESQQKYNALPATYHTFGLGGEDRIYPPGTVPFAWPGMDYMRETNTKSWDLRKVTTAMQ